MYLKFYWSSEIIWFHGKHPLECIGKLNLLKVQLCAFYTSDSTTIPLTLKNWRITSYVPDSTDFVVDSSNKCLAVRTVGTPLCPGFHKNVSFAKWTNQIAEMINILDSTTLCLTRFAASLLELNSSGLLNKHNIMHYFSYNNSKWFRQTHQYHTNIRIFRSSVQFWTNCQIITICHFLMTCCNFGTSDEYLYSYFGIFRVNQNNFHWCKINLIKSSFAFQIRITQNQRTNQRAAAKASI